MDESGFESGSNGSLVCMDYDELIAEAVKLTPDQKLDLVKALIPAPMQVVMGGSSHMTGSIIIQVNMADRGVLADVLEAMSDRIRNER